MQPSGIPRNLLALCASCKGRSAKVEFFVEYGPLTHTKAVWENEESGPYSRKSI